MNRWARVVLWATTVAYGAVGGWALLDPVRALAEVHVAGTDPGGVVELRAMYGGLQLGLAAYFAWCTRAEERLRGGLLAAALSVGGLGGVRAASLAVVRPDLPLLYAFAALELTGAVLAAVLFAGGTRGARASNVRAGRRG